MNLRIAYCHGLHGELIGRCRLGTSVEGICRRCASNLGFSYDGDIEDRGFEAIILGGHAEA